MNEEQIDEQMIRAYRLCFTSPAGQAVMQDLVLFCRMLSTTYGNKTWSPEILEGRRQVFLRIQRNLSLTADELYQVLIGRTIRIGEPADAA